MNGFPILGTSPQEYISWEVIAPHEEQAMQNHGGQTLRRLAERGGLSWEEALSVLEDRPFRKDTNAREKVIKIVKRRKEWG